MSPVTKQNATIPCEQCGAAMILIKVEPDSEIADLEQHEFRCEICSRTVFHKFKMKTRRAPAQHPTKP